MKTLDNRLTGKQPYIKIFILGFATAFCLLLPFLVIDKGFFLYAGDFNSQQIPFYMNAVRSVQAGNLNWSWNTDLGTSFVNGYAFYLLGSPVFWLFCLFPPEAIPYLMPYGLMIKFATASLGAFCYMRRYAKDANYAYVGAILYAFSGFSVYNIFFNHFLESVALFPFLLWALDEFVLNKRRGPFVFFVALNLVNNYFFFVGQVVFLLIYFICKVISGEYKIKIKTFALLTFESILGCLCGIVLLIPSLISIVENPRSTQMHKNFGIWLYSRVQQYFAIIFSAFYPPEVPYSPNLFTECSIKWTSMSAFLVMGSMFGFFVFLKYRRKSAFTKILICSVVASLVPVFNSAFYAFNDNYYARWFYMPLLILATMNMQSFAMCKQKIFHGLKYTAIITLLFSIFALTPNVTNDSFKLGLQKDTARFWLYFFVAAAGIFLVYILVQNYRHHPKFAQKLLMCTLALTMLYGVSYMAFVKIPQSRGDSNYIRQNYTPLDTFTLNDDGKDYRIDAYQSYNNVGLFLDVPCMHFFNSTVTPSILEFYPYVGTKRDVSSKASQTDYALRCLLSVKYVIMPTHEYDRFLDNDYDKIYSGYNISEPYNIMENDYFIPFGFTYDYYVNNAQLLDLKDTDRSKALLKAILVNSDIIDRYKLGLERIEDEDLKELSFKQFKKDVAARQAESSYFFEMTKDGFTSRIVLKENNLVFYSVPYDKGFTAYVNGEESEIHKVNSGLCAVYAPAGDNEIIFKYETPGLKTGIILNLCGLGVYIAYLILIFKKKVKI